LYALQVSPADRFEAQLVVLLRALGPLVVYGAVLDVYARNPSFVPNGMLCVALIDELASRVSLQIARDWQSATRLLAALDNDPAEPLTRVCHVGELLGTLSFLESQTVITGDERRDSLNESGLPDEQVQGIWGGLHGSA